MKTGPLLLLPNVIASPEGHLPDVLRGKILATLRTYAGAPLDIEIRKHRKTRSLKQNRRHFALMRIGAHELWGDKSLGYDLHDELAHLYFALPACEKTGLRRRRRTPDTETGEFADFTTWCADKLIEYGADLSAWDEETRQAAA